MVQTDRQSVDEQTLEPSAAVTAETVSSSRIKQTFSSLAIRDFRILWLGMFFSLGAFQIELVARSWLAFDLSGSAFVLGVIAISRSVPQIILSPFAGVAADRFDRRQLLLVSQSIMLVLAVINALLVQTGTIQVWQLFVLGFGQGIAFPFTMPTRSAMMAQMVGRGQMANALALESTNRNLTMIAMPAIAGVLIALNPTIAFYAVVVLYSLAVGTLFWLPKGSRGDASKGNTFSQMAVGFKYIWSSRLLTIFIVMALIPILIGMPYNQLLPVFQKEVFDVGPTALGLMFTAGGVGALIGSLGTAVFSNSPRLGYVELMAGVAFGIFLTLFALSPAYPVSLVFLFGIGVSSQIYLTINRSLLMINTDPNLYGRVTSIYSMMWYLMPVSLVPMGIIVDRVGAPATVAVAGMLVVGFMLLMGIRFSSLIVHKSTASIASSD